MICSKVQTNAGKGTPWQSLCIFHVQFNPQEELLHEKITFENSISWVNRFSTCGKDVLGVQHTNQLTVTSDEVSEATTTYSEWLDHYRPSTFFSIPSATVRWTESWLYTSHANLQVGVCLRLLYQSASVDCLLFQQITQWTHDTGLKLTKCAIVNVSTRSQVLFSSITWACHLVLDVQRSDSILDSGWPRPCCQALRICEAPCCLSGQMSRISLQKQIRQKVRTAKMQCFGCRKCRKWFRSHLQVALPLWCAQAASFLTSASSWVAWVAWHSDAFCIFCIELP